MADVLINKQNRTILNILACQSQGIFFSGNYKNWVIESKYNFLVSLNKISLALIGYGMIIADSAPCRQ